jgi:MFS family permease
MSLDRSAPGPRLEAPPRPARHPVRFWSTAYTVVVLLTGTNLATPLYRDYGSRFGFSPLTTTLVFAVYVMALIPSLLLAGPLADAIGRRRVLLPAVALAAAGSVLFAFADGTGWLIAARILQGVAVGAASGALTAALTDVEPRGDRRRAARVSTVASAAGLGLGPLLAGLLAEYAPAPHVLPFLAEVVLLVPAAIAVAVLPAARGGGRWQPRRPQLPPGVRAAFATTGMSAFLAFAVIGLFLSLVPTYVTTLYGRPDLLVSGATTALLLACSAAAQLLAAHAPGHRLEIIGLPLLAGGLVLLAVAGEVSSLRMLLVAIVIAGIGQGLAFLGGLTTVNEVAPVDRRAEVLSSFYVVIYLGVGLPVIGVGFAATTLGLLPAVQAFACLVAALCLCLFVVRLWSWRRRSQPHTP